MKMKKALSILLVVCMCISLMAGCQWLPAEPTEPATTAPTTQKPEPEPAQTTEMVGDVVIEGAEM